MYSENNYIMWLSSLMNIKISNRERLLNYFGSAEDLWQANSKQLEQSKLMTKQTLDKFVVSRYKYNMDKEIERLNKANARFVTRNDEDYPVQLLDIPDSPFGIYIKGKIMPNTMDSVAIVGSRRITDYGASCCDIFAKELAQNNIAVVSGLAMGTDAIAHKSCMKAGGTTFAVLGTGIDVIYPTCNYNIAEEILEKGCVISEFPIGTKAYPNNFPIRNRIISGMSDITVIIEADTKSGTMITANHALEQGKTVMALPGNITSRLSSGTNHLIRLGAVPVTKTEDILEEMGISISKENINIEKNIINSLAPNEKLVYDIMDCEPITIDEIVEKTKLNIQDIAFALTMLEVNGLVSKLSGQKYTKTLVGGQQ